MFIKGTGPQPQETRNMPWVQDGTYSYISSTPLIDYNSIERNSAEIMNHYQTLSMLYLLKHFNKLLEYTAWHFKKVSWNSDTVEHLRDESLPQLLKQETNVYPYTKTTPGFKIIESVKYNQQIFPALDKFYKDEKQISMVLQESISHRVRIYKHENYYTILTNEWTWGMCRKLISLMPHLFNMPVPESVIEIFMLFGTDNYEEWAAKYNNWIQSLKLMDNIKLGQLTKALAGKRTKDIETFKNYIQNYTNEIDSYMTSIKDRYAYIRDYQHKLYSLEQIPDENGTDLYNYLKKNKSIVSFTINGQTLYLTIRTAWNYYDQAAIDAILKNPNSDVCKNQDFKEFISRTHCTNPRFELWSDAAVYIKLNDLTYGYDTKDKCSFMPQTHIHYYGCWGNNKAHIQRALSNRDFISTIEQIIAATKNLNWYDGPVIRDTIAYLTSATHYKFRKTIKDLKTGEMISFKDAIKIIVTEETEKEKEKEMSDNAVYQDNPGTTANDPGEVQELPF